TVAQRVLASLAPPIRVNERDLDVTASMGISVFPEGGTVAEELLRSADQAMYSAKRAGRNTYSLRPHSDLALPSSKPPDSNAFPISNVVAPAPSALPVSGVAPVGGSCPSAAASSVPT